MKKLRIVFMGTPQFAVAILNAIHKQSEHEIVGVITAADKPAGRGQKLSISAVKEYALENNLPLFQPEKLKNDEFISQLQALKADLQVVVAFRMLPEIVWKMPKLGTFNLHASLLPNYRGAAPINWAIINGETKTGVTTFFIDDKIDTGQMILRKEIEIQFAENAGELHDKLMNLGSLTVLETLHLIATTEKVTTTMQPENNNLKTAYKLNKENCKIDFSKSVTEIYNLIRGLSPYPSSWCNFLDDNNQWNVKIYKAEMHIETHKFEIGKIIFSKKEMKIAVLGGFIELKTLQMPGKKPMKTSELLNGQQFSENLSAN